MAIDYMGQISGTHLSSLLSDSSEPAITETLIRTS